MSYQTCVRCDERVTHWPDLCDSCHDVVFPDKMREDAISSRIQRGVDLDDLFNQMTPQQQTMLVEQAKHILFGMGANP